MNILRSYANSFGALFVLPLDEETFVLSTPTPSEIYQSTGTMTSRCKSYFNTTNIGQVVAFEGLHSVELYALYSLTGLTWKQLAEIFGVGPRMIHYWIDGSRPMTQTYSTILNNLSFFTSKNKLPAFTFRKFFEDNVLKHSSTLKRIQSGENQIYNEIEKYLPKANANSLSVSVDFLRSRLPEQNPIELMSLGADVEPTLRSGKSRSVKVLRPKKK
jgi:hypothetical protein